MISIAGMIRRTACAPAPELPNQMATSLRHRFDAATEQQVFTDPRLFVAWAINTSEGDPEVCTAWNEEHTVWLLFAGEAYASGGAVQTGSILASYLRHGETFLGELNGQFCGVLVDLRCRTATLFNDRYGLGRIYYHEASDAFYFATEAKALLAALPSLRRTDPRGVAEFHVLGCVLQNRSLFRDVLLLPPGSRWTFRPDGGPEKDSYFTPAAWEQQEPLSAADYRDALREVFGKVMPRYLGGDLTVGLSLTGGLDSRAVIAWTRAEAGTLPCYTFGGPYRDCADVRIARELARVAGQTHTTIRVADDFFREFDALAERAVAVSDGTMDVSGAVELYVNRIASGIATVRLTGNYGSEILRSYRALRPRRVDPSCFTPDFGELLDEAVRTYHWETNCHPLTFIAFKQMPWHHFGRLSVERSEVRPRSPYLDNALVALAFRAPPELRGSVRPMLDLIEAGAPRLARVSTDRAIRARRSRLVGKVAAGWQELTVKAEYAYDYGMPQWLARADRLLTPLHVERLFLGRHKFYHFRIWYRDQLRAYVREQLIASRNAPPCYRPGAVARLAAEHLAGTANHTMALHKALSLQLIEQLFVDPR